MKKDIHPSYYESEVKCACGNVMKIGSVMKKIDIEICSSCHPFFVGTKKILDSSGRVERFMKRYKMEMNK